MRQIPKAFSTGAQVFSMRAETKYIILTKKCSNSEILGRYTASYPTAQFDDDGIKNSAAELILKTELGGNWAILGYAPWKGIISLAKRDQILNIADYISGNSLPARLITPIKAALHPRKNDAGQTVAVSITNCTVGKSGILGLLIRNPKSEKFLFMSQYNGEEELSFTKIGND